MPVSSFTFVSPGVQVNEIDESARARAAEVIGPVIVGRATKGSAMTPIKVRSTAEFVATFGDTVPGGAGNDVYRDGNDSGSPMYGTYAAKAFLHSGIGPVTYIRLLGVQDAKATSGYAGWTTDSLLDGVPTTADPNGGAFGLWVAPSASMDPAGHVAFTGSNSFQLGAIIYVDKGSVQLSGTPYSTASTATSVTAASTIIRSDAGGKFTLVISGATTGKSHTHVVGFNDNDESFIRKRLNTNPQLRAAGDFFASSTERDYWLGETFEQEMRDASLTTGNLVGFIGGIQLSGNATTSPANMSQQQMRNAVAGWFISQDTGEASSFVPGDTQKLFRLHGRRQGEWMNRNVKASIEQIRPSLNASTDYGTFSVVLRNISDTDNNKKVIERFDNLNLNPASPNYISRRIGDTFKTWVDAGETPAGASAEAEVAYQIETGEYANVSKYVYVEVDSSVESKTTPAAIPFGYHGPPKWSDFSISGSSNNTTCSSGLNSKFLIVDSTLPDGAAVINTAVGISSSANSATNISAFTASIKWPSVRLRLSASEGGLSDPTDAYWGYQTTRAATSTLHDQSSHDPHRLLYSGFDADPVGSTISGVDGSGYIFTLDYVVNAAANTSGSQYFYLSGTRENGTSFSSTGSNTYKSTIDVGINQFTAPFWGGCDGLDIRVPDPMYNNGIPAAPTLKNSSIYYSWNRAIVMTADAEQLDMNLMVTPGLTNTGLNTKMMDQCRSRGDTTCIVDLASVYIPPHEQYKSDKTARIGTSVNTFKATDHFVNTTTNSYACTYYPWVQTRDANSGQLVWIPPSVAMLGVFASSEKSSQLWFAPAGFNRGGLSNGAAGIPIVNVSQKLTSKARDDLYTVNINPIASFPSSGIVVFGQKTLQNNDTAPSALDRINVRRLSNYIKKSVAILAERVLFEQNVPATWNAFQALVEPFLANIMTRYGITSYDMSLMEDAEKSAEELQDTNTMYAKIAYAPARSIEFIVIDFVITKTGVGFAD